jgi:hypothetical protein
MSTDYRTLNDAVRAALAELNRAYDGLNVSQGTTIPTRTITGLMMEYASDANLQSISKHFTDAAASIGAMRSSYLPQELFPSLYSSEDDASSAGGVIRPSNGGASIGVRLSDNYTEKESYENAFMRMLGMPSSNDERFLDESGGFISYISTSGELIEPGHSDSRRIFGIEDTILDERQKNMSQRLQSIDDAIFNQGDSAAFFGATVNWSDNDTEAILDAKSKWDTDLAALRAADPIDDAAIATLQDDVRGALDGKNLVLFDMLMSAPNLFTEFKALVDGGANGSAVSDWLKDKASTLSVYFLHEDFFAYKGLLTPPIQDGRISECLSEPNKIVAGFFSDSTQTVNNANISSSLLEAVIRLRFDKASGQSASRQIRVNQEGGTVNLPDSYGALESLLIVRLRSAIGAYAKNVRDNLEKIMVGQQMLRTTVSEHTARTDSANLSDDRAASRSIADDSLPGSFLKLEHERTVELAILTLFGNTSGVPGLGSFVDRRYSSSILDAEVGTLRNSSVINAHLIGPTLNIVGLPLAAMNRKLSTMKDGLNIRGGSEIDRRVADIRTILGVTNGVGAIDVAVFSLALFSLKEELLLALLPKEKIEAMVGSEFGRALVGSEQTLDVLDLTFALNSLTKLIHEGYSLFTEELKSFRYEEDIRRQQGP